MPPDRLTAAIARRASLAADPYTTAYRLVHRAADGFPDLAVDRYGPVLVAHVYSRGRAVPPPRRLLADLAERAGATSVYVKYRPTQARVLSESQRAALAPAQPLLGPAVEELEVVEGGLRYLIRPGEGLSTGLFLDMREMRAWVRAQAQARPGLTVLNCFAYTCAFGVAALAGGAGRAANLDISRTYLAWGQRNTALNGFEPVPTDFIFGDVDDWLRRFARAGRQFDLVILDPPSFGSTRKGRFAAEQDYAALVARAAAVVSPGGQILACANTHALPERAFHAQLRQGLAGTSGRIVQTAREPELDFPVPPGGGPFLKIGIVAFA